jgi:cell wall-associated NlpC family hydrolase
VSSRISCRRDHPVPRPRPLITLCSLVLVLAVVLIRPLASRAQTAPRQDARRPAALRRHAAQLAFGLRVAAFARRLVGVRYSYGGSSPRTGFDCSGFVRFVYAHFGVPLAHSSFAQFVRGRHVLRRSLRPGDLVFFDGRGHVGIYIGNGHFVHAPHTGARVRVESLDGWYSSRFDGARRLKPGY